MAWLIDANVPLRALHRPDPLHSTAWNSVAVHGEFQRYPQIVAVDPQALVAGTA